MFHKYYCITLTKKQTEHIITMLPSLLFVSFAVGCSSRWRRKIVINEDSHFLLPLPFASTLFFPFSFYLWFLSRHAFWNHLVRADMRSGEYTRNYPCASNSSTLTKSRLIFVTHNYRLFLWKLWRKCRCGIHECWFWMFLFFIFWSI